MIKKTSFSEELGRNIIWVMLSGFLKIGAKRKFIWSNSFAERTLPF